MRLYIIDILPDIVMINLRWHSGDNSIITSSYGQWTEI